ncbi:uncharacterized protein LOC62_01G000034 [Vanrija pseudolonga]|uniref:Uncharacterized protein n=1 Tax=Vanrija pseudolonga TaxID=143232 RepID=A0AAF0XYV3_9TREE|nr:hypothetical protein LOC62_01G000034 [Vanrija pseudolonga]
MAQSQPPSLPAAYRHLDPVYKDVDAKQALLGGGVAIQEWDKTYQWSFLHHVLRVPGMQRVFPRPSVLPDNNGEPRTISGFLYMHADLECSVAKRNNWPTLVSYVDQNPKTGLWQLSPCLWCRLEATHCPCPIQHMPVQVGAGLGQDLLIHIKDIPALAKRTPKQQPKKKPALAHNTRRRKRRRSASVSSAGSSVVEVEAPDPLAAVRVKVQRLETVLASLHGRIDCANTANDALKKDNADLKKKVKDVTTENDVLRGMVKKTGDEHAELKDSVIKIANATTMLGGSMRKNTDDIGAIQATLQKAMQDIGVLNATMQKAGAPPQPDPSMSFRLQSLEEKVHGLVNERTAMQG